MTSDDVKLRALVKDDIETLRALVNDVEVMKTSNTFRPISDVEQLAWFEAMVKNDRAVWFGIASGSSDRLVGTCCLVDVDWFARQAELRVRVEKASWGTGVGTAACTKLLEHAFQQLNLDRVWLRVFDVNPRARAMYEKLGFVVEGTLRRAAYVDGALTDVIVMGLLRDEWKSGTRA
jgi:diamine N-acetyltransferase